MFIFLSLLFALVGVLLYFVSTNPKVVEIGRITFFAGILAFLLSPGPVVSFLSHAGDAPPAERR
jgi:hypothetical protein